MRRIEVAGLLAALVLSPASWAVQLEITPVLLTGDIAPGIPPPGNVVQEIDYFLEGRDPALFVSGRILAGFGDALPDGSNDSILWRVEDGIGTVWLREGTTPTGMAPGTRYALALPGRLGPDGSRVVRFFLTAGTGDVLPDGSNEQGYWLRDSNGVFTPIIRHGEPAPAFGGDELLDFTQNPVFDSELRFTTQAVLQHGLAGVDDGNDLLIYGPGPAGPTTVLLREGSQAPGTAPGTLVAFPDRVRPGVADTMVFAALLKPGTGEVPLGTARSIVYTASPEQPPTPLLRWGDPVSEALPTRSLGWIHPAVHPNAYGWVGFSADVVERLSSREAVLRRSPAGDLDLLARVGDIAPGTGGIAFSSLGSPEIGPTGAAIFDANLDPLGAGVDESNERGLWFADADGAIQLLVRDGDSIGQGLHARPYVDRMPPNAKGQIGQDFEEEDGTQSKWILAPGQAPILLLRTGDLITVRPGDTRTLASFVLSDLSRTGRGIMRAVFTDDSVGVFEVSLPADDADGDGIRDLLDNCEHIANGPDAGPHDQFDDDGDGTGNLCDGDFNQDDFVGGPDFDVFLQCFDAEVGQVEGPPEDPGCGESDMNGDGFVGGPDFDAFLRAFGAPPGAPPATPAGCGLGAIEGALAATVLATLGRFGRNRFRRGPG